MNPDLAMNCKLVILTKLGKDLLCPRLRLLGRNDPIAYARIL